MAAPSKTDVFQFMSVRSPQSIKSNRLRNFYIRDEYIGQDGEIPTKKLREVFSINSESQIGRILYRKIFCEYDDNDIREKNDAIVQAVLETLEFKTVNCEAGTDYKPETLINDLEQFPYIYANDKYYLLPTALETINSNLDIKTIISAQKIIGKHLKSFDKQVLLKQLRDLFGVNLLTDVVFKNRNYHPDFQELQDLLFERLYTLYILRRVAIVNLEQIIGGLQTVHILQFLAVDDFLDGLESGRADKTDQKVKNLMDFLPGIFPELQDLDSSAATNNFEFIHTAEGLRSYFESTPVIHPIVAQLQWYRQPFNKITPIGIGDLKVVKQWLIGYKMGEISDIHNIMKGETNEQNYRHLERTEETFSFSSENNEDTQKENQSTDRFETKKEAENVIKTDLNVGAHADMTYNNAAYGITVNVGGNFAYSSSSQDTQKSASNYAREVMDKAVTNIQTRTTQNRTVTKIFETEENNKHAFTNTDPAAKHISGIYRWLDKKYKAALYNYGKRLMFEFIIPEPAAFYVMSKLKAAEFDITAPKKPDPPDYETAKIVKPGTQNTDLTPADIDETVFNQLRLIYDLSEFTYPQDQMSFSFSDLEKKNNLVNAPGDSGKSVWINNQYKTKAPEGYDVEYISMVGTADFNGKNSNNDHEKNKWLFMLNGVNFWDKRDGSANHAMYHTLDGVITPAAPIDAKSGDIILDLNFQNLNRYSLMVFLGLKIDAGYKLDWQTKVYKKVQGVEQSKVDKVNQEKDVTYMSQMADYRNKLNELNSTTVNDIIQGKSEAFNQQIIRDELKKHCLTMIAKEFDSFEDDDILSNEDALEDKTVEIEYEKFFAGEVSDNSMTSSVNSGKTHTIAGFIPIDQTVIYPKINLDVAKNKARYIQFLEQAFEWQNIAYIFYPYFWAAERKWIELMNRLDYTDNNMTNFLKAGSVRVLIAVTPNYNDAVMHFLATREPWDGGPLPVIGDTLFIPIYEEIRNQQDDLQNAVQEGDPWEFELPTSLIYLQDSSSPIPTDLDADNN